MEAPVVTGFSVQPWSQLCDHISDRAADANTAGQGLCKCMVVAGQEVLRSKGKLEAQSPPGILNKTVTANVGTRNPGWPCQMLLEKDNESFKRHGMRRGQQPASKKHSGNLFSPCFQV